MIFLGPVHDAANGGHGNPFFDLIAGLVVLALTWVSYARKAATKSTLGVCIGLSVICGIFIYFGIAQLVR